MSNHQVLIRFLPGKNVQEILFVHSQCAKFLTFLLRYIDPKAFEVYMSKRLELQDAVNTQNLQLEFQRKIRMIENDTVAAMHARKIREEIINLYCS